MFTLSHLPISHLRSPLPLHRTPSFLRLFGFPGWRMRTDHAPLAKHWIYVTKFQYFNLFGRKAP